LLTQSTFASLETLWPRTCSHPRLQHCQLSVTSRSKQFLALWQRVVLASGDILPMAKVQICLQILKCFLIKTSLWLGGQLRCPCIPFCPMRFRVLTGTHIHILVPFCVLFPEHAWESVICCEEAHKRNHDGAYQF
jgi:hypothetical protein